MFKLSHENKNLFFERYVVCAGWAFCLIFGGWPGGLRNWALAREGNSMAQSGLMVPNWLGLVIRPPQGLDWVLDFIRSG